MYHRVRTDLFLELVWRRIWLGDKSWTNCRSVLGQQLYHDAVREVLRDARASGGTFSRAVLLQEKHDAAFGGLVWLWRRDVTMPPLKTILQVSQCRPLR